MAQYINIENIRKVPIPEFAKQLQYITLLKDTTVKPYQNARISLKEFHAEEVNPSTFYLIRKNLEFQMALRQHLLEKHGVDTLRLDSFLEITSVKEDGTKEIWGLTPPVIELTPRLVKYHPQDGEVAYEHAEKVYIPIIVDGLHRVFMAKQLGLPFNALYISGASEEHPFYAHPNHWDKVRLFDETPKTMEEKKLYTRPSPNYYYLYRDFNSLGIGQPRGVGKS
jgi:hypothetical protein